MTPCVEDAADEKIGIDDLSYNQNSKALLILLVEEINEKTTYTLRLIPWKHCGKTHHRILVRQDHAGDADLVRRIRIRGLDKGVTLTTELVEQSLEELWKSRAN